MGCGSCGTGASGKPSGCQSNGGCSSGGCNRMNVFDWLAGLPLQDSSKPYPVTEVTFNAGSRKEFYKNNTGHIFEKGEWIAVEGTSGFDVGQISLQGELVKLQMKKYGVTEDPSMKKILRPATEDDLEQYNRQKAREQEIMVASRAMAKVAKLDMKIAEVELQADGRKGTFFYTADQRVDFREIIKQYATEFRIKVEMKQIGARQESGKVGGIGSCGRELCCSTWLTDFKSVNTSAARYQNLSINQTKLSGQCGRLKCCLNYELDTYMDALKVFPTDAESIETTQGRAFLQKRDIFKNLMWYSYMGSTKQYPMTIDRVKEISALNKEGIKPDELKAVEIEATRSRPSEKVDMGFVNDVGQITLKKLEKSSRNKKKGNKQGSSAEGAVKKNPESRQTGEQLQQTSKPKRLPNATNNPRPPKDPGKPQTGDNRPKNTNRPPQRPVAKDGDGNAPDAAQQLPNDQQGRPGGRSQRAQRSRGNDGNAQNQQPKRDDGPSTDITGDQNKGQRQPQRSRNVQKPGITPPKDAASGSGDIT